LTGVAVGSTHIYIGHLIVSKVDEQGNIIEEEVATKEVSQSFPRAGNYTVTVEIQGYSGSLSVVAGKKYEIKIIPPGGDLYPNISYTFTAKLLKSGKEIEGKTETFQKTFATTGTYTVSYTIDEVTGSIQVNVKRKCAEEKEALIDAIADLGSIAPELETASLKTIIAVAACIGTIIDVVPGDEVLTCLATLGIVVDDIGVIKKLKNAVNEVIDKHKDLQKCLNE